MLSKKRFEAIRIVISAYTASFRVPHFVDHQLTLTVPPPSTIFGIISAAAGRWVTPQEVDWFTYTFTYEAKDFDLENIITVDRGKPEEIPKFAERNILKREFLLMPELTLYLPPAWEPYFKRPRYSLLLGRTQDLAFVESIDLTELEISDKGKVGGVLLPLELIRKNNVSVWLQNLPVAFTDEPRRKPISMRIFGIVDAHRPVLIENGEEWLIKDARNGSTAILYQRRWILGG